MLANAVVVVAALIGRASGSHGLVWYLAAIRVQIEPLAGSAGLRLLNSGAQGSLLAPPIVVALARLSALHV